MLSAAKHLLYLIENKQKQILRFAQDDMVWGVFPQPPRTPPGRHPAHPILRIDRILLRADERARI